MAADSHVAEEDSTVGVAEKIWECGGLLFGYSGQLSVREPLKEALHAAFSSSPPPPNCPVDMAGSMLSAVARPVLERIYADFVGAPGDDPAEKVGGSLLVIGHDGDAYWLLELTRHNMREHYTEDGFHTVGSASLAAHVGRGLLSHYSLPGYEVQHLRLLAYRTVDTCIKVLGGAYMVGGPVQLWHSTDSGFARVTGDELESVEQGVVQWIAIEQESLERVFADETEAAVAEPLPERLDDQDG